MITTRRPGSGPTIGAESPSRPLSRKTGTVPQAKTPALHRALQIAHQQIGKPYICDAEGPNAYDCSGLLEYSLEQAGIPTPGRLTTWTIAKWGRSM
jgi:peptidoglycan DL-endopeptidase CwlO